MKKIVLVLAVLAAFSVSASAQFLDFSNNKHRVEVGILFGQVGSFTQYANYGPGFGMNIFGFYADFVEAPPQHRFDNHFSDTRWEDTQAYCINAGYQIPLFSWLYIMPLVGYAQTNEGITDASTLNISNGEYSSSLYHDYDVTPGSRIHYFNYGGGISIQPIKWFSLNFNATRYAIYGGISLNLAAFAQPN